MAEDQRRTISTEGKITILLALVGLGGVGALQVLPQPYNDYVGWTLIWLAIIGVVVLGIYHVATTVESPRYEPKPRKKSMTAAEIGFLSSIAATAAALVLLGLRHRSAAAILALVACVAVAFDFVDRQWFSRIPLPQAALTADNARVEIRDWVGGLVNNPNPNAPKQYGTNLFTINKGKHDAVGMRHSGIILLAQTELQPNAIDAFFPMLKAQINLGDPPPKARIEAGANNVWFTILSGALTDGQVTAIGNATIVAYVLNVMQYRDDVTPDGKFIYTESCVYYVGPPVHICPRGDNVSYISD